MLTDLDVRFEWIEEGRVVDRLVVGSDYELRVYATDDRGGALPGIALLFLDVDYNAALVNATADPVISSPVITQAGSNQRTPGGLRSAGGVNLFPGEGELLLFSTEFDALSPGEVSLTSQISLTPPSAFGDTTAISRTTSVSFAGATISVVDLGIAVTPTTGLFTSEAGTAAEFQVSLLAPPVANVVVPLSLSAEGAGEATLGASSLVFTPSNWNLPQTVVVRGIDDPSDDGDRPFSIRVGPAVSTDPRFDGRDGPDVAVVNRDDDTASLVVEPRVGLAVSESGTTSTVGVRLATRPLGSVSVLLTSDDPSEVLIDGPAVLSFTPSNWDIVQIVTLRGAADLTVDGPQSSTVRLTVAAGSDAPYASLPPVTLAVATDDRDTPSFSLSRSTIAVDEAGGTGSFRVMLDRRPAGTVVLRVIASDTTEAVVTSGAVLTFTPDDWATQQTVTVTGVDDSVVDGPTGSTLTVMVDAALTDDRFDPAAPRSVSVTTADDDVAGFVVQAIADPLELTEGQSADAFAVRLTAQPLNDVVIELNRESGDSATLDPPTLRFTPADWDVPRVVVARGVEDNLVDGTAVTLFRLSVLPGQSDPAFSASLPQTVSVTTRDNDTAAVSVARRSDGSESGAVPGAFVVTLSRGVAADTVIEYSVGGVATAGSDYAPLSGRVVAPAGVTEFVIPVPVIDDTELESAESVVITLTGVLSPTGVQVDPTQASAGLLIADNEAAVVSVEAVAGGAEGSATPGRFVLRQNLATTTATVVTFGLGGTAGLADYVAPSGTVTIAPGETQAVIDLVVREDALVEGDESVLVTLTAIAAGDTRLALDATRSQASVALLDDDFATVRVSRLGDAAEAGTPVGGFVLSQSSVSTADTSVTLQVSGEALEGADFAAVPRTVTIPAGQTSVTVALAAIDDAVVEGPESVALTIAGVTGANGRARVAAGESAATAVLLDDDAGLAGIEFVADGSESGPAAARFRVTLSTPSASDTLVRYSIGGSASEGIDFVAPPASVLIPAGQTAINIEIPPIDDTLAEPTEEVSVTLTGVSGLPAVGVNPLAATATARITDNEVPQVFVSAATSAVEGDGSRVVFTVFQELITNIDTVLRFELVGAAIEGDDYTVPPSVNERVLTIPAGASVATIELVLADDRLVEGDETVRLNLPQLVSGAGSLVLDPARASGVATIGDNDNAEVRVVGTAVAAEGAADATISFALSAASAVDTRIDLTLAGSATEGADFRSIPRSVTVPAGQLGASIPVLWLVDGTVEPTEDLVVSISRVDSPIGRVSIDPARSESPLRVLNTDRASVGVQRLADGSEQGAVPVSFTVTLSTPSSTPTVVSFSLAGSATPGVDFGPVPESITIPAGQLSGVVSVPTRDDADAEGPETLQIVLGSIETGANGGEITLAPDRLTAVATLVDNESPLVFLQSTADAAEAGQVPGGFVIAQNLIAATDTVLTIALSGEAAGGVDYTAAAVTVTIPAGSTPR